MPLKPPKGFIEESDPRVAQFGHPAPPWMVNYADLMTELVIFYLIMFALSSALSKPMQEAKKEIQETLKQEEVAGDIKMTKDGLVLTLREAGYHVFFKSGQAEISADMEKILNDLEPTFSKLAKNNHEIIVEGYTDDVPIQTARYASNWELSSARATSVVKYLIHNFGYPRTNIAAVGYGDTRLLPRQRDEDTVTWRARNRRVIFLIKNPKDNESKDETS